MDNEHAIKAQLVRTALELGVIPTVAAGHHDAEGIAAASGCSPAGMRILLDGLCALGLLRWSEGAYTLTATAEAYLVPGKPTYCAPL